MPDNGFKINSTASKLISLEHTDIEKFHIKDDGTIHIGNNTTYLELDDIGQANISGSFFSLLKHITFQEYIDDTELSINDAFKYIQVNKATNVVITIPDTIFDIGTIITFIQMNTGQIILSPALGVVLHTASSLKTRTQYSILTAVKIAPDVWHISGDME